MSQNQSSIRFSLEETIWFKKGQEVEELLSISLDPHITIQESDQYVVIKGDLHLSGEYIGNSEDGVGEQDLLKNYVQSTQFREEDGVFEFYQSIPVDVTIPIARITSLEELDVNIDSFDYEIQSSECIKLNTDLSINGIVEYEPQIYRQEDILGIGDQEAQAEFEAEPRDEQPFANELLETAEYEYDEESLEVPEEVRFEHEEEQQDVDQQSALHSESEEELYEPFSVEARISSEEVEVPIDIQDEHDDNSGIQTLEPVDFDYLDEEDNHEDVYDAEDEIEEEPTIHFVRGEEEKEADEDNAVFSSFAVRNDPVDEYEYEEDHVEEEQYDVEPVIHFARSEKAEDKKHNYAFESSSSFEAVNETESEKESPVEAQFEEETEEEQIEVKEVKKKKKSKYEAISLTDFFARKEEEQPAKLKVCIVQNGETLDLLAEKYDIHVQQIIRMNHLEANQDVYEGQVLYVPSYASTHKKGND
ncbi:LysM peptidoglycan-binding domain-containing protein [Heyndrickxia ginsengihumi]|uniref:LysM peptidoglycan-binding domain-containing protein n=1 Tax=Heyndrickxia ginsengihumi TaxID=363870 RepID=UPI003D1D1CCA